MNRHNSERYVPRFLFDTMNIFILKKRGNWFSHYNSFFLITFNMLLTCLSPNMYILNITGLTRKVFLWTVLTKTVTQKMKLKNWKMSLLGILILS